MKQKVYLYTANDIRISWKYDGKSYLLYLPKDFTSRKENEKYYLNKERSEIIGVLLESVSREIKHEEMLLKSLRKTDARRYNERQGAVWYASAVNACNVNNNGNANNNNTSNALGVRVRFLSEQVD